MVVLCAALILQVVFHGLQPKPVPRVEALKPPPSDPILNLASLGEQAALARILMLWLQAFDYQPGVSIPFKALNYHRIIQWLGAILTLDPRSQYPLLSAARVYTQVEDNAKRRMMLDFVYHKFLKDPDRRWPWMTHAVYVAAHLIGDKKLALKYARAIRTHVTPGAAPYWAIQMELFVLADMGKAESAKVLLGGLLASGVIKDKKQLEFLKQRLNMAEQQEKNKNKQKGSDKSQAGGSHKPKARSSYK
ncbi:MAG: hypothetical protein P8126_04740 [Gammaproteobacteria bacterium]|jgi:hypothetical protein